MKDNIRILHLSDLHLPAKGSPDAAIVLDALTKDLEGKTFDIVVFSGDLVSKGSESSAFARAKTTFIEPVLSKCSLGLDRFFICPGNHDIDKSVVEKNAWVEAGLVQALNSRQAVNDFVDQYWAEGAGKPSEPFSRCKNFYRAIWSIEGANCLISNQFVRVHKLAIDGRSIGIVCANSAWRCTGRAGDAEARRRCVSCRHCVSQSGK